MMDKHEFLEFITYIPDWVNTKTDALNYSRHLNYRLLQATKNLEKIKEKIKIKDPSFFDDNDWDELYDFHAHFDDIYNNIYHKDLVHASILNKLTQVK
jgi:hypothetical protein